MASAIVGTGTTVTHDALDAAHKVKSISLGGMSVGTVDGSVMSTTTWIDKLVQTLVDAGTVSLTCEWLGQLPTLDGATAEMVITFPNSNTLTVDAICTGWSSGVPLEDVQTIDISFKLTGEPVFA
jgi:hypothetical protein